MSDSDEEDNFELFGTPLDPLDEDTIPKKKPFSIEDQIATDDQGRRRFHGAFTGGFSAGFFNTVGSSEGWKPSEFRSSRSEKANRTVQKPEDFMDTEDLSEFGIAPKKLKATSDYEQQKKRKRPQTFSGPIPGEPILFSLLEPAKETETVGVKLLKKMGWKPGQGVGPRISKREKKIQKNRERSKKIYGCQMPSQFQKHQNNAKNSSEDEENSDFSDSEITFAPDDFDPYLVKPKNDNFGLGYFGLVPQKNNTPDFVSNFRFTDRNNKKFSISGQAFGVGAFETEDSDIYHKDDISNYDFEIGPPKLEKKVAPNVPDILYHSTILDGFIPQKSNRKLVKKIYPPPEIPKNFVAKHGVRISRFEPLPENHQLFGFEKKSGRHDLKHFERRKILDEKNSQSKTEIELKTGVPKGQNLGPVESQTNLDEKIQSLLDSCKNQNELKGQKSFEPLTSEVNLNSMDLKLDSKDPNWDLKGQNFGSKSTNMDSKVPNFGSKNPNSIGQPENLLNSGSSKSSDWKTKLFSQNFSKGETLGENLVSKSQNSGEKSSENKKDLLENVQNESRSENSFKMFGTDSESEKSVEKSLENENLLEKARKITENLPKVECKGFKPFLADPEKQKRYETYLSLKKSNRTDQLSDLQPISMSTFEKEREKYEFEQAAKLFKPSEGLVFDKFVTSQNQVDDLDPLKSVSKSVFDHGTLEMREAARKKLFGPLTRVTLPWQPHKLLCRRFNVPEPKMSDEMGIPPTKRRNRFNIFDYYEAYQQNRPKDNQVSESEPDSIDTEEHSIKIAEKTSEIEKKLIEPNEMPLSENESKLVGKPIPSTSKSQKIYNDTEKDEISKVQDSTIGTLEKSSSKNNQVSYEKIFSKTKSLSSETLIEPELKSNEKTSKFHLEENITIEISSKSESEEKISIPTDPKAKKDLFKAIFLSSDESEKENDSESESESKKELDSEEKLEEMKKIVEESLTKNVDQKKVFFSKPSEKSVIETSSAPDKTAASLEKKRFFSDLDLTKFQKSKENSTKAEDSGCKDIFPNVYGPALPQKSVVASARKVESETEWKPTFTKPVKSRKNDESINSKIEEKKSKIFKLIEDDKSSSSESSDEWVEASTDKNKKKKIKEKKVKKHKKHKEKHRKHKSKHKKRKKGSDSD